MGLEGKIVFISGAITGVEGYRKIFADAEQWLREQDCTVLNPAVLPPSGMAWEAYLRITKAMVREADVVFEYNLTGSVYIEGESEEEAKEAFLHKYDGRCEKLFEDSRATFEDMELEITDVNSF